MAPNNVEFKIYGQISNGKKLTLFILVLELVARSFGMRLTLMKDEVSASEDLNGGPKDGQA